MNWIVIILAVIGLTLIEWTLWQIFPPLVGISIGLLVLRAAWNLDEGNR